VFINCYWCDCTVHKAGDLNLHFFHSLKSEWLPTIFFQKVLPVCVKDRKKFVWRKKKSFLRTFCIFLPRVAVMIALSPLTLLKSFSHTNTHTKSSSEHTHPHTHSNTHTHKHILSHHQNTQNENERKK